MCISLDVQPFGFVASTGTERPDISSKPKSIRNPIIRQALSMSEPGLCSHNISLRAGNCSQAIDSRAKSVYAPGSRGDAGPENPMYKGAVVDTPCRLDSSGPQCSRHTGRKPILLRLQFRRPLTVCAEVSPTANALVRGRAQPLEFLFPFEVFTVLRPLPLRFVVVEVVAERQGNRR
jgi:hypothetical protein